MKDTMTVERPACMVCGGHVNSICGPCTVKHNSERGQWMVKHWVRVGFDGGLPPSEPGHQFFWAYELGKALR